LECYNRVANANHQRVLRDLDPNVFQRSRATAFSCSLFYGGFEATIDLGTLEVIEGQLPRGGR
jgi:hypothetical protein